MKVYVLAASLVLAVPGVGQSQEPQGGATRAGAATLPGQPGRAPSASQGSAPFEDLADPLAAEGIPPAIPATDPTADADDPFADEDEPRPQQGQRQVQRDGDLATFEDAPLARDGIIDVGEPPGPVDGVDATTIDTRPEEDFQLFQSPDDTADPLLFQIEDIEPRLTDRRTRRLFEREPYEPIGIRIGSFVYFPETEVSGAATSNVRRQTPADSDVAAEIRTDSRLVSDWKQHAVELRTTSFTTFHNAFPGEDDRAWGIEGRGRLDITRRTNLQGQLSHDVAQEGRSAIDANLTGDRAEVVTQRAALTLNHRFNRLSIQLRGTLDDLDFGEVRDTTGAISTSNDDRDTLTTTEAARATWEFKPTFSVFGEVETNQRDYKVAALSDGLIRDSDGQRYRLGIDFGSTSQILRGEVSLGWGQQNPKAAGLDTIDGILIDANLAWRLSGPTTLLFTARSDIFDSTTANSAGVMSRQIGVEARHAFLRHLIATAGISYTDLDYEQIILEEQELRATLGLEYFLNREWVLFGRYEHIDFASNEAGGDWTSNDVRLGVRWRR